VPYHGAIKLSILGINVIHRIRAAGIVVDGDRILLIKHGQGDDHAWVPPGGGLEPDDGSTKATVKREVLEESGLVVEVGPLVFVREFIETQRNTFHVEQFYLISSWQGNPHLGNLKGLGGDEHVITAAEWLHRDELHDKRVYPEELKDLLWTMLAEDAFAPVHLGVKVSDIPHR